jgi:hypothetical protein
LHGGARTARRDDEPGLTETEIDGHHEFDEVHHGQHQGGLIQLAFEKRFHDGSGGAPSLPAGRHGFFSMNAILEIPPPPINGRFAKSLVARFEQSPRQCARRVSICHAIAARVSDAPRVTFVEWNLLDALRNCCVAAAERGQAGTAVCRYVRQGPPIRIPNVRLPIHLARERFLACFSPHLLHCIAGKLLDCCIHCVS